MQILDRDGEVEPRESLEQRAERNLAFHSGQRRTETEMDAVTEREVTDVWSIDIKRVRLRVSPGIAVRCRHRDDDLRAGGDCRAADRHRLNRVTERRVRHGRVVAED